LLAITVILLIQLIITPQFLYLEENFPSDVKNSWLGPNKPSQMISEGEIDHSGQVVAVVIAGTFDFVKFILFTDVNVVPRCYGANKRPKRLSTINWYKMVLFKFASLQLYCLLKVFI